MFLLSVLCRSRTSRGGHIVLHSSITAMYIGVRITLVCWSQLIALSLAAFNFLFVFFKDIQMCDVNKMKKWIVIIENKIDF